MVLQVQYIFISIESDEGQVVTDSLGKGDEPARRGGGVGVVVLRDLLANPDVAQGVRVRALGAAPRVGGQAPVVDEAAWGRCWTNI